MSFDGQGGRPFCLHGDRESQGSRKYASETSERLENDSPAGVLRAIIHSDS